LDYRGRRILVVGLARSGVAAAEFLARRGARVTATDLRSRAELSADLSELERLGVALALAGHPPGIGSGVDLLVTSPGVPGEAPPLVEARAQGVPVWGELELAAREIESPIVAVTGTKGKSTTTTWIAAILRQAGRAVALGGNIGRPLIGLVPGATRETVFVVEVSSFQLETIERFRPAVAVLLNVAPDHLDRYPSYESYLRAKARIFANQQEEDWAVVYAGNPLTVDMASRSRSRKVYFSLDCLPGRGAHLCLQGPWVVKHEDGTVEPLLPVELIPLRGRHNVENALAAAAVADLLGVPVSVLSDAVASFRGIPHALEKVGELNGVAFYDDSKATNVTAALAALKSFDRDVILILGGRSKGGDFGELRAEVSRKVKLVLALGESRDQVAQALAGAAPLLLCVSLREAVETAFAQARPGDTVLLSPACASFDMFRDYAERGERFREEVLRLGQLWSSGGQGE
jgi:UDP-N-acetylmuramoylalanine--D-glutamate ligase